MLSEFCPVSRVEIVFVEYLLILSVCSFFVYVSLRYLSVFIVDKPRLILLSWNNAGFLRAAFGLVKFAVNRTVCWGHSVQSCCSGLDSGISVIWYRLLAESSCSFGWKCRVDRPSNAATEFPAEETAIHWASRNREGWVPGCQPLPPQTAPDSSAAVACPSLQSRFRRGWLKLWASRLLGSSSWSLVVITWYVLDVASRCSLCPSPFPLRIYVSLIFVTCRTW